MQIGVVLGKVHGEVRANSPSCTENFAENYFEQALLGLWGDFLLTNRARTESREGSSKQVE